MGDFCFCGTSRSKHRPGLLPRLCLGIFKIDLVFLLHAFFMSLSLAILAAVCLYARHFNLAATNRKAIDQATAAINRLRWQQNPDLEKGWAALLRQHEAGINLLNVMRSDNQLLVLEEFWNKIPETERSMRFETARNNFLGEPGLSPLLRTEEQGLADVLVPEVFDEEAFAREPERLMRLVNLLLEGRENGLRSSVERSRPVDSESTRNLYRSAILSRFVASFLLDLSVAVAAKSPQQGI
mmetsp:Transcript_13930/g.56480  ORF Transcript_13930/g.56480 Transcript_13930/m.56480 type:complete len:240 (-) Transcript_13930:3052-3771(-)